MSLRGHGAWRGPGATICPWSLEQLHGAGTCGARGGRGWRSRRSQWRRGSAGRLRGTAGGR
eukprot:14512628-Heterocapsa_arctica.AAC.1